MKILSAILAVLVAVAFVGSALAVPAGKTVEYAGGDQGKVIFDGKAHADKGAKCNDCHTKIFGMKKGVAKITKEDHGADKFCGVCHNGTKAPSMKDEANCGKCHKK
ncbi:MAG TPA: c(7)-type cytochrome triheme domain-containing protein [Dissulfurispiraceae bacterium]|nr:c(7)-type cytochrome triheme domain-containing protein [Dissulfurispiraceae bacterium]